MPQRANFFKNWYMGKINVDQNDLEVTSMSAGSQNMASKMPYMSDPTIVPRVQKYLETNIDKTYVDINQMADELQKRYREYSKRKRSAFRASVKKAYSIVLRSYGLEDRDSTENELLTSDSDEDDDASNGTDKFDSNTMNNTMLDLYGRTKPPNKIDENELIDISSDSEDDGKGSKADKVSRNPASQPPKGVFAPSVHQNDKRQTDPPILEQRPMKKRKIGDGVTITPLKMNKKAKPKPTHPAGSQENVTFKNVGGMEKTLEDICKLLLHVKHPELYKKIGISPPRGFLLHGPPGCGKTLLANAIAGELGVPMIKVAAPELVAGVSGESEERIRELFERAVSQSPCILFVDEIDAITQNRQNAQKEMERRIVAQILSCLDDLSNTEKGEMVLVIGATNRADSIDPALRRAGRFDREICLGIPDVKAREQILRVLTSRLTLEDNFDYEEVAKLSPGYVGADLLSLTRESAMNAVNRVFNEIKEDRKIQIALAAQKAALKAQKAAEERRLNEEANAQIIAVAAAAEIENIKRQEEEKAAKKKEEEEKAAREKAAKEKEEAEKKALEKALDDATVDEVESSVPKADGEEKPAEAAKDGADTPTVEPVSTEQVEKMADSSTEAVVLLDDSELEVKKSESGQQPTSTTPTTLLVNGNGNSKDTDPEIIVEDEIIDDSQDQPEEEEMKIDDPKELTTLEELQGWLHDSSVISDDQLTSLCITMDDFSKALKTVQPSAKREGFATVPDTTWEDVGSLRDIREELQMAILAPVQHSDKFEAMGLDIPAGVLLCGPPGCGKTLLAKAVANEAGINFISVKGPELLNMYVGESERAVRVCFERARNSAPCVIFFDELDALCPKRSDSREGGATMRVVNQMLTEMDGIEGRKGVFLLAASNRPDIIDPAVLRPGRLDKILYVGLPSREDRVDILRAITKNGTKPALDPEVDLFSIGTTEQIKGYTGADLAALVREASVLALKEHMFSGDSTQPLTVCRRHFLQAMDKIRPSVSEKDQKHYEKLRVLYSAVSTENQVEEMEYS